MAKKKITQAPHFVSETPSPDQVSPMSPSPTAWYNKLCSGFIPYALLTLVTLILYSNTFQHQFALDDDIVICKNEHVLQGMQGIPSILSEDLFDSYYKQMNTKAQLGGGRYRPLSVATFALEQEFLGTLQTPDSISSIADSTARRQAYNAFLTDYFVKGWDKNKNGKEDAGEDINQDGLYNDKDTKLTGCTLRHINNALLYALACCVLFLFLRTVVFKETPLLALLSALLFAAHPIHTEVVANMKSRDEILSVLFMLLTLYTAHRYAAHRNIKFVLLSALCMLSALLSKEYGATLLALIPLSLYLFGDGIQLMKNKNLYLGYAVVGVIYFLLRKSAVIMGAAELQDDEVMNNPYKYATEIERWATQFYIVFKYFWLQIFPHPLISDYGYNSIPYKEFSDPLTLLGFVLLVGMGGLTVYMIRKKNWMAFALAFYLLNLLLVTNFIFNIGATMGERLVFHSSIGFCMILAYGLYWIGQRAKNPGLALLLVLPILFGYSLKTISRNKAWKNDISLALTDVEVQTESVALNGNAASRNIDLSELPKNKSREKFFLQKSIGYGMKAIGKHPEFVNGYINLAIAHMKLQQFDSARIFCDNAFRIYPSHPQKALFYSLLGNKGDVGESLMKKAYELGEKKQWKEGKKLLQQAVQASPNNAQYWYDLGGFAYNDQDMALAKEAWSKAYQLNPTDTNIIKVQPLIK